MGVFSKRVHIATAVVCAMFLVESTLDREGHAGVLEQQQHGPWQSHLRSLPSQLAEPLTTGLWSKVFFGDEDGYEPFQNMPKVLPPSVTSLSLFLSLSVCVRS
jgi:hypothetical protein